MDVDPVELAKTYSEYTDEKLLNMASSGTLTEIANKVLVNELSQRGIPYPHPVKQNHVKSEKLKINGLSIVSGISGALIIVVYLLIAVTGALFPPHESPLYGTVASPIASWGSSVVWLLALIALIAGIFALLLKISIGVE